MAPCQTWVRLSQKKGTPPRADLGVMPCSNPAVGRCCFSRVCFSRYFTHPFHQKLNGQSGNSSTQWPRWQVSFWDKRESQGWPQTPGSLSKGGEEIPMVGTAHDVLAASGLARLHSLARGCSPFMGHAIVLQWHNTIPRLYMLDEYDTPTLRSSNAVPMAHQGKGGCPIWQESRAML